MLALTPGEPGGIGPDLVVQLAASQGLPDIVVLADPRMLRERAALLNIDLQIHDYPDHIDGCGHLTVLPVALAQVAQPGSLQPVHASGVLASLDRAIDGCLQGEFSGLVTGPIQKSNIIEGGFVFSGHTEYLQQRAGVEDVVMLLVAGELRVALATTHLPLSAVPAALSTELLERRLRILHHDLGRLFDQPDPSILVSGLNPHAGESGHLGSEEQQIIIPVLDRLRKAGMNLQGPLPADTLFTPRWLAQADAVMAMFHDQGLPVLKYAGFGQAVNVTLGLPFIRTSVDHGTALDLAGSGGADTGSMAAAINLARQLDRNQGAGT